MKKLILISVLLIMLASLFSQTASTSAAYNSASIYLYSGTLQGSERLKIKTYIWGQVRKPGLYIVPDDTDLLTLMSSAGGPTENAKLAKIRIVRPTRDGEKIIWINIKKYMETGDQKLIPTLMPGDTVIVSGTVFYALTKAASFLSNIAIFFTMYTTVKSIK